MFNINMTSINLLVLDYCFTVYMCIRGRVGDIFIVQLVLLNLHHLKKKIDAKREK